MWKGFVFGLVMFAVSGVKAAEIGDVMYSDGTYSANVSGDKIPIGVVFWTNTDRTVGAVLALNQPADMTLTEAKTYCANYSTLGTSAGVWKLPTHRQSFNMVTQRWNGVSDNKMTVLNTKLGALVGGQALKNSDYWTISYNSYWRVNPSGTYTYNTTTTGSASVRCVMAVSF